MFARRRDTPSQARFSADQHVAAGSRKGQKRLRKVIATRPKVCVRADFEVESSFCGAWHHSAVGSCNGTPEEVIATAAPDRARDFHSVVLKRESLPSGPFEKGCAIP
jgi:hypothetical protein